MVFPEDAGWTRVHRQSTPAGKHKQLPYAGPFQSIRVALWVWKGLPGKRPEAVLERKVRVHLRRPLESMDKAPECWRIISGRAKEIGSGGCEKESRGWVRRAHGGYSRVGLSSGHSKSQRRNLVHGKHAEKQAKRRQRAASQVWCISLNPAESRLRKKSRSKQSLGFAG